MLTTTGSVASRSARGGTAPERVAEQRELVLARLNVLRGQSR
ncbi:Argininosuccinate lyase ArgH [Mycobacteroides abscessus subsp. massiliense]|nr:Argininosuccinate lyase ArgH [Mycobacteroides abscessus subsp. massiliense]